MAISLSGKCALVTGSSGGIGAAIARELASVGASLILHGNKQADNVANLADELRKSQISTEVVVADLSESQKLPELIEQIEEIAPVDILVNNAGVDVLTGTAAEWNFEQKLSALWQVDVQATMYLSRALGTKMRKRGSGSIINVGWAQAEVGMAGDSGEYFAAVKGAVMAFTRSLAKSLAPQVRVNCVAPGWIQTKWGEAAPEHWQKRAIQESVLKRWGTPEDVARVVRFLASPESAFVNGQIINVDGGFAGSADEQGTGGNRGNTEEEGM